MNLLSSPRSHKKNNPIFTGFSVNECQMFLYMETANITIPIKAEDNRYYTLIQAR